MDAIDTGSAGNLAADLQVGVLKLALDEQKSAGAQLVQALQLRTPTPEPGRLVDVFA